MREKLNNIEGAYLKIQEAQTLLNLISGNYFDMGNVDRNNPEQVLKLIWEYKTYQTVLFVSTDIIYEQLKTLKESIDGLYRDLRSNTNETTKMD